MFPLWFMRTLSATAAIVGENEWWASCAAMMNTHVLRHYQTICAGMLAFGKQFETLPAAWACGSVFVMPDCKQS
jgi:hypothetical protein